MANVAKNEDLSIVDKKKKKKKKKYSIKMWKMRNGENLKTFKEISPYAYKIGKTYMNLYGVWRMSAFE